MTSEAHRSKEAGGRPPRGRRWDTGHLSLKLTPIPEVDLVAEYTRTRKEGHRPFGMPFGFATNNFLELLAPIEETVHDFRVGVTLARQNYQLQFEYALSMYENDLKGDV